MKSFQVVVTLLLLVITLIACERQPVVEPDAGAEAPVTGLIEALRAAGITVEEPVFNTEARTIEANGESVQVFVFESEEAAEVAAGTVSQAGTLVGETIVEWQDAPHFYREGRLIAIYVGSSEEILSALQGALGEPFVTGVGMRPPETPES
ncbi:MAG TPA: hypothetical protein VF177_21565 [Anaerolineae bacterium]